MNNGKHFLSVFVVFFIFVYPAFPLNDIIFITLASTDEGVPFHGNIISITPNDETLANAHNSDVGIEYSGSSWNIAHFKKGGYYGITVQQTFERQFFSVFVSPVPSVHADNGLQKGEWYQTQFNSGALSNCGPASCAMAISWAQGSFYPVSAVRKEIGWHGDGATTFEELIRVIKKKNIFAEITSLTKFDHIKNVIDTNGIAIVLFKTDGVSSKTGGRDKNFFDKYYIDDVGHYIVIKGYSKDGKYLVVYDPIPSDWTSNNFRHYDGQSMIGKNCYYKTDELLSSLRRRDMIAVKKS